MRTETPIATVLVREVLWRRLDEPSLEHCRVQQLPEPYHAYSIQGTILTVVDRRPYQVQYVVLCGLSWRTREVDVHTIQENTVRRLHLRRDDTGAWWRDDERLDECDGLEDIDLSLTPATNTLPIRRLGLNVGDAASTTAVWVRFPELTIEPLPQRYIRTGEQRYSYESRDGAFTAELDVDEEGVVVRYGELWERVSP